MRLNAYFGVCSRISCRVLCGTLVYTLLLSVNPVRSADPAMTSPFDRLERADQLWANTSDTNTPVANTSDTDRSHPDQYRGDRTSPSTPSFVKHVVPLFNKIGCSARECHGAFQGQNGFRLSLFGYDPVLDHDELTETDGATARVQVDHVDHSLVLRKPLEEVDHEGGQRLEHGSWQHRLLQSWIAGGAPFEADSAPYLELLETYPSEISLKVDQSVQLRSVAHFADGSCEESTPLTTFASNDDSVAQVDEDGQVTATGFGNTSIVVSYAGGVVTSRIHVPRPLTEPSAPWIANNRADDQIAAQLRKLGIRPSSLSSDEAFVRRAYLDVIGTLPTADEVRDFLQDTGAHKRSDLIDRLLQRPEYAIYWATIFSDWTGNNRSNINTWFKTVWLWNSWLRDKLRRNVPYDELVGGIITATSREGRSLDDYLAEIKSVSENTQEKYTFDLQTYAQRDTLDLYWLKRMPDPEKSIAIRTANAFLGVQIQCAECHKHPFDRWTQNDFEGFVSIFRTVQVSNLDGTPFDAGSRDYDKIAAYRGVDKRFTKAVQDHPPKILAGRAVPWQPEGEDPRVVLWDWMRSPDNEFFAHNIVNRLWEHYFGLGIVDPVDDFNAANPPSNPELLHWLARDFIEHQFDLKHLHRRILNTRAYQLSHVPNDSNRSDRRNFSHALIKRMPAEVALDALARITGTELQFKSYAAPAGTRAIGLAAPTRYGASEYVMDIFGRPKREQTCACERSNDASLAQALYLLNDADIHTRITDSNGRLAGLLRKFTSDRLLIEELYLTCLSRFPHDDEWQIIARHLRQAESRAEAMQDVVWSLINVREFLFVQ